MTTAQKLLFIDIETHPAIIASWSIRSPDASAVWVEQDTHLLCFAAQWSHKSKVHTHALPDYKSYKKDKHCDRELLETLASYLDEADYIAAHNGDRFDVPIIMGRLFANKIRQPAPFRTLDTYKISKRFKFDSHKLDNIGRITGEGRKLPNTGAHLWRSCSQGDMKAWEKMRRYCAQDTALLARTYKHVGPWMKNHPAMFDIGCHVCGSFNVHRRGPVRKSKNKFQFNCLDCGHWYVDKA